MDFRIGHGVDLHPFGNGSSIVLGGVTIPHSRGLIGHSDADVLCHAIMDALLGAAGLPDIGQLFPNTDKRYAGARSLDLLGEVMSRISQKGWRVQNCDSAIICEEPKLAPFIAGMKENLADSLNVNADAIGIKATTAEKLGSIGRGEGVYASAVALLYRD